MHSKTAKAQSCCRAKPARFRVVKTRRFDTKRAAADWERRQRSAFDEHGYDLTRGKVSIEDLLSAWLEQRAGKVSETTLNTDRFLLPTSGQRAGKAHTDPVLPTWFRVLHAGSVTSGAVSKWQADLTGRGLAPTTVKRYRESLSSFLAGPACVGVRPAPRWCATSPSSPSRSCTSPATSPRE